MIKSQDFSLHVVQRRPKPIIPKFLEILFSNGSVQVLGYLDRMFCPLSDIACGKKYFPLPQ